MKHLSKQSSTLTLVLAFLLLTHWTVGQEVQPKVKISRDTTYVDGPLTKDGYIDYVAHFNKVLSKGVTVENNAAVLLVQTYPGEIASEEFMKRYCDALGIKPVPLDGDHYEDLVTFLLKRDGIDRSDRTPASTAKQEKFIKIQSRVMNNVWTEEQYPDVKKWLDENEKHFDTVRKASLRKRYYHPLLNGDNDDSNMLVGVLLPQIQSSREYARALTIRGLYYLGIGENDKCIEDMLTMRRLGNLIAQGGTIIEQLVGIAILGIAQGLEEKVALSGKLSAKELLDYRSKMMKTRAKPNVAKSFGEFERLMYLDCVQQVMKGGIRSLSEIQALGSGASGSRTRMQELLDKVITSSTDWMTTMEVGNKMFDKFGKSMKTEDWIEKGKALASMDEELKKMSEAINSTTAIRAFLGGPEFRGKMMGRILVSMLMPALNAATAAEQRIQISDDLSYLTFSIAAFKAETGLYPNSLDELADKIDGDYPTDRFSNDDFLYRPNGDGFVVYSVGVNGKDDNGDGVFNEKSSRSADDYGRGYQTSKTKVDGVK